MKKIIALFLSLAIVFSVQLPAFAENEEMPTIYVTGAQTNEIMDKDGNQIYPTGADTGAIIKEAFMPCLEKLVLGFISGDYEDYGEEFNKALAPVFEKVRLDQNGEASDGSTPKNHWSTVGVSKKQSGYGMWTYRFWYDWRLSPVTSAAELKGYIDRVTEATGKDKVQLVGRCYGANVIQAYLALYGDHAIKNVSDVAYYSSSAMGIDFMSALFAGELTLDPTAVENFAEFYVENENLIEDPVVEALIFSLVELFNQVKVLGYGTELLEDAFNAFKYDLVPDAVLNSVGSWPSYWAMVTPELYEKAKAFIFDGREQEYAKFIEKTDYYYNNVALTVEETILSLKSEGINFCFFSKYGFPDFPLYEGATADGDSYTTLERQSFGATSADFGKVLSEDYISSLEDKAFLSPDLKVDASTGLLPETSWFFKNLHHNDFSCLHSMTLEIMRYDLTVLDGKFPQYYNNEDGTLIPITGTDADAEKAPDSPLASLLKFITALFRLLTNIIKGELSFAD